MIMLGVRQYTVTRLGAVSYVSGLPTRGAPETFTIAASIQPLNGRDLQRAGDGLSATDTRKAYVLTPLEQYGGLRTVEANGPEADLVDVDGVTYQVHTVSPYDAAAPIPHQRVYLHKARGTDQAERGPS